MMGFAVIVSVTVFPPAGPPGRITDRLLEAEEQRIGAGGTIPFGTSCLAVCVND